MAPTLQRAGSVRLEASGLRVNVVVPVHDSRPVVRFMTALVAEPTSCRVADLDSSFFQSSLTMSFEPSFIFRSVTR